MQRLRPHAAGICKLHYEPERATADTWYGGWYDNRLSVHEGVLEV